MKSIFKRENERERQTERHESKRDKVEEKDGEQYKKKRAGNRENQVKPWDC